MVALYLQNPKAMVKLLIIVMLSIVYKSAFGQNECRCDSMRAYLDEQTEYQLVMLCDSPPCFENHKESYKIRMLLTRYNCAVRMVVDTLGNPQCVTFMPEIDSVAANNITKEINKCVYSPALILNKKIVSSLLVIPLAYYSLDGQGIYYETFPKPSERHIQKFIKKNLRYPDTQIQSGYVLIYILLDDKGNHIGYEMPKYSDSVFCDEALSVAKMIQFQTSTLDKSNEVYNFYPICIKFDKKKAKK